MDDLPFLLAHGRHFWVVAVALGVVVALALRAARARGRLQKLRASALGLLGTPRTRVEDLAPSSGVALAGTLGAGGSAAHEFLSGSSVAAVSARADRATFELSYQLDLSASGRAQRLALRVGNATVGVDGPVLVLAGSQDQAPLASLRQLGRAAVGRAQQADDAGAAVLLDLPIATASLHPGASVVAWGRLEPCQGPDGQTSWALRPGIEPGGFPHAPPMKAVLLVASQPGTVRTLSLAAAVRTAPLAALAAFVALVLVGEVSWLLARSAAAGSATFTVDPSGAIHARSLSAGVLASLSPLRSRQAARVIAADLPPIPRSLREARLQAALWSLSDQCSRAVELLAARGLEREVWEVVARCEDPATRWAGAMYAGARGRASRGARYLRGDSEPPEGFRTQGLSAVQIALLAGRRAEARELADLTLEQDTLSRTPDGGARPVVPPPGQYGLLCLRLALAARGGRADALPELRTRVLAPYAWQCAMLLADVASRDERARVLGSTTREYGRAPGSYQRLRALLLAEVGAPFEPSSLQPPDPVLLAYQPTVLLRGMVPGLERSALAALGQSNAPGSAVARARLALSLASFEAVLGAPSEAHRLAEQSRALFSDAAARGELTDDARDREDRGVSLTHAAIDLRALAPEQAERHLARVPESDPGRLPLQALARYLREGASGSLETFRWDALPGAETMSLPWREATSGDVPALVELLEASPGTDFFRTGTLAYALQPSRSELAPVRRWFTESPRFVCWRCYPRFVAARLAHEAMLASRLGLRDVATRDRRGLAELRNSLLRRETAVVLRVVEDL